MTRAEKDIDLHVEGNTLTVCGERKLESGVERQGYRLIERTHGSFYRSFNLPDTADAEHVTARARMACSSSACPSGPRAGRGRIKVQVEAGRLDKALVYKQ